MPSPLTTSKNNINSDALPNLGKHEPTHEDCSCSHGKHAQPLFYSTPQVKPVKIPSTAL